MDYILNCGIKSTMQAKYKWLLAILMTLVVLEVMLVSRRIAFTTFNTGTSKPDHQEWRLSLDKEELTPPENTRKTSPENTRKTSPEKTGNTSPQTTENTSPKNTRKTSIENTGKTVAEITRNTPPQNFGKIPLENTGNSRKTVSGITGNAPPKNTGNSGEKVSENTENTPIENIKNAPPENTENAPPENTGNAPPENTGNAPPENTENAPPENTGNAPPENTGNAPTENTGNAPPENTGNVPPENTGNALPENTGNAPPENTGNAPPENTGNAPPENTGNAPPENTGNASPENTGNVPPENTGNSGKTVSENTETTSPENTGNEPPMNTGNRVSENTVNTSPGALIWNKMYPGFIMEEEAMTYKQCKDVNTLTSPNTTKLLLKDNKNSFKLNDRIQLTLIAHDYYGKAKTEGGDLFLATIKTDSKKASAPGVVTDLQNGSYKVEFDALWTGKAAIRVTLAFTKQNIAAAIRLRIKHLPAAYMIGYYNKDNISDTGYCHVNRSMLIYDVVCKGDNPVRPYICKDVGLTPERTEICNFTSMNGGTPWFCLKPLNKELGCDDWTLIDRHNDTPLPGTTVCEQASYHRIFNDLSTSIEVNIESQFDGDSREIIDIPSNQCSKYDKIALWLRREPTGFYYNGFWHLRHCKGVQVDSITNCMKNKNFYIIGDSTVRQWYFNLMSRYGCEQTTEEWSNPKWYKESVCRNNVHNFTLTFAAHNLPVSVPYIMDRTVFRKSISSRIDEIADNENAVLIFHLFGHLIPYHPEFYKLQLTNIRNSAERLFKRNNRAKIMIKAPHIFPSNPVIMAYQYDRISYEVFYDYFDRIYYLNNKDSSTAEMPETIHPDFIIVNAMLDQALLYSCD